MPEYYNVTTNLGYAEIANAIATNTKLDITHVAFGDGNGSVPTPNKARTSLVREVHRQAVTKYERHATNANWIVIETIIPSSIGGFWVREMGIIANGKLISHGSHAPFEKVADPSGVSEYRLRFTQNVTDGSVVKITLDESLIYASQAWVKENFIKRSEIVDNLTTNDATKPVSAKQAKILQDNKLEKNANAVSATKLQTARTIAISGAVTGTATGFDGSANISIDTTGIDGSKVSTGTIPAARIPTLNQSTTGNAGSATKLQTARKINNVLFDGTEDITIQTATTSVSGTVQLANNLEAQQGENSLKAITPASLKASFQNNLMKTGYSIRPDGFIEQWGLSGVINDENTLAIKFPIKFPEECFNVQLTENKLSTTAAAAAHVAATDENQQGFNLKYNSSQSANTIVFWRAIGK